MGIINKILEYGNISKRMGGLYRSWTDDGRLPIYGNNNSINSKFYCFFTNKIN